MSNAVVVGLGMGVQYVSWFRDLGYTVTTVDTDASKNPDHTDFEFLYDEWHRQDIIYIGTPNYTHESIARQVASHARLLLIEKPGFKNQANWMRFVNDHHRTRVMMVKNNQYRPEVELWRDMAERSDRVNVCWERQQGIPTSAWFTNPKQSYGGVSRDLMPHMLSYYTNLTCYDYGTKIHSRKEDFVGVGVDTYCIMEFVAANDKKTAWTLVTNWQTDEYDSAYIEFIIDGHSHIYDLGALCPAEPYKDMITTAVNNIDNNEFWNSQYDQDVWIHKQIGLL